MECMKEGIPETLSQSWSQCPLLVMARDMGMSQVKSSSFVESIPLLKISNDVRFLSMKSLSECWAIICHKNEISKEDKNGGPKETSRFATLGKCQWIRAVN